MDVARARHEQQARTFSGPEGPEDKVAEAVREYDECQQRISEMDGISTGPRPANTVHGFPGTNSGRSSRYSDIAPPPGDRSRNVPPPRPRRDFRRLTTSRSSPSASHQEVWRSSYPRTEAPAVVKTAKPKTFSWEKVTAAITAVAVVGGAVLWFTSGSSDEKTSAAAGQDSVRTVELASRSLSMHETSSTLLIGDKEKITQAEKSIPQISAGDPQMKHSLDQAFDYAKAKNVLANPDASPEYLFSPSSITDVALRQRTNAVLYIFKADEALKSMGGYSGKTPEEVERAVGDAPKGAESVKAHAKEAIKINEIDDALSAYRTSAKDDEARAALQTVVGTVTDPDLKQKIQSIVQGLDAAQILEDLYLEDATPADVLAFAQSVTDPQLKMDLIRLTNEVDPSGYYAEASSYSTRLSNDLYDVQAQQFGDNSTNFATDLIRAKDEQTAISAEARQATRNAQATYTETLAEEADLKPHTSGPALIQEDDPYEVVDLTELEATEEVPNVAKKTAEGDEGESENFNQFGEVYVEDGEMEVTYQKDLSSVIREQFDQVVESNDPLLQAAFSSGSLVSVRFVLGDEFNPYYNNATREAVIQVADNDEMTVDQLSSAITHELTHSNLRDFFKDVEVSDGEHQALAETCLTLQRLTYQELGGQLSIRPDLLDNLRAAAKPEHQAAIDTLAKAVEDGNLTSLLSDFTDYETTLANQCDYTGNPSSMIQNAIFATPDFDIDAYEPKDYDYLYETSAYGEFADAVGLHLEYGSIFSQVINESQYAMTESFDKIYLGHSREAANELFASLMDAALNYPDQLQANLTKLLDPEEEQAVLQALSLACDVLEARAPSLKPLLDGVRRDSKLVG
jgi:hypothetical protein